MSTDDTGRAAGGATPTTAAGNTTPTTAAEWQRRFVSELRAKDVPGTVIGDALAEVDAHCADSGQRPLDAFGDPETYAASVAGARGPASTRTGVRYLRLAGRAAGILVGVFAATAGADGIAAGGPAMITAGTLLTIALGPAGILGVVTVQHRVRSRRLDLVLTLLAVATMAAPQFLWRTTVARLPAGWVLGFGLAAVVASLLPSRRSPLLDRIVDPRTGAETIPVSRPVLAVLSLLPLVVVAASIVTILATR